MQRTNKKNRKNFIKKKNKRVGKGSAYRTVIPSNNGLSVPDSEIVELPWIDDAISIDPGSSSFGAWQYRLNSVYDPDPIAGGQSAYNFDVYASLYRRYLVLGVKIETVFVNKESFPVSICGAPSTASLLTSISSAASARDVGEMPYAMKPVVLSAAGGLDRTRAVKTLNLPRFSGNAPSYRSDISYSSLVNTNPPTVYNWTYSMYAGTNFVNGIEQQTRISFRVLFSERNYDLTGAFLKNRPLSTRTLKRTPSLRS